VSQLNNNSDQVSQELQVMPTPEEIAAKKAADKAAADEAARKAKLKDQESDDEGDDEDEDDEEEQDSDLGELNPKAKAHIEKLRKENAKARLKNKELETKYTGLNDRFGKLEGGLKKLFGDGDDDLPPEKKIEKLSQQNEGLALSNAMKEAALEHGVGKADYEYFEFLVQKKMQGLKDDEELGEEELAKLAKQAKAKSAAKSTSVEGGDGPPPDEDDGSLTLEEFSQMGIVARSALYQKDKATYEKMVNAEKAAKKKK
jgi:hypothetical protein